MVGNHQHKWTYADGKGNGVLEDWGFGRNLYVSAHSPMVLAFMKCWIKRDKEKAKLWLEFIMSNRYTDHVIDFENYDFVGKREIRISDNEFHNWYKKLSSKKYRYSIFECSKEDHKLFDKIFNDTKDGD